MKNKIQLYPKSGRLITSEDNYNFTSTKDLDIKTYSNGYIYVNFLKTLIPSNANIEQAFLYLHIANIGGITSEDYNITIDVYEANDEVTLSKNIEEIRDLKGKFINSYDFKSNSIYDEEIKINITDYVKDYIYGSQNAYGLIIEPKIKDLSSMSHFNSVYDENNNRVFLIGGQNAYLLNGESVPDYNMEVYIYDVDKNTLNRIETDNRPSGRTSMYTTIYNNALYMYGGKKHENSTTYYDELWKLNLDNYIWEQLNVDSVGGEPGYLSDGSMIINKGGFLYLIYGADENGTLSRKIWTLDLNSVLYWVEANVNYNAFRYIKPASKDFAIVKDDRMDLDYSYFILGGTPASAFIYRIELIDNNIVWKYAKNLSDKIAIGNGSAALYNNKIYYFIGYSSEPTDNSNNSNNILYEINPHQYTVQEIKFEGTKLEKRYSQQSFLSDNKFYVINGYIDSWGTLRNSSSIWYTDLSDSSKRWTEVYNNKTTYNNNANTIRFIPITSYDTIGERQGPCIDVEYSYDTVYDVNSSNISSVITRDSYISLNDSMTNFGSTNYVEVQKSNEISGVEKKGLFYLNLSSISSYDDVLSAILYIPRSSSSEKKGMDAPVKLITEDWLENQVTWVNRKTDTPWNDNGGSVSSDYTSYNMVVGSDYCKYDITRLIQQMKASFGENLIDYYGLMFEDQNVKFDSRQYNDSSYLEVVYIDESVKRVEDIVLISPNNGEVFSTNPVFKFKVPQNATGNLHFEIKLSKDISFADSNVTSYSTVNSATGWSWNSSGNDVDYVDFPTNGIIGYNTDVSLVKFDMSTISNELSASTWFWRIEIV